MMVKSTRFTQGQPRHLDEGRLHGVELFFRTATETEIAGHLTPSAAQTDNPEKHQQDSDHEDQQCLDEE